MTKTYKKYLNLVTAVGGLFTEQEVISFRSYLRSNQDTSGELLNKFYKSLEQADFQLTPEQKQKGIDWLRKTQFKLNGDMRKNAFVGEREADMIRNYKDFTFSGLRDVGNGYYAFYVPVYKLIAQDGSSFEYSTNMGQCEVL